MKKIKKSDINVYTNAVEESIKEYLKNNIKEYLKEYLKNNLSIQAKRSSRNCYGEGPYVTVSLYLEDEKISCDDFDLPDKDN